MVALCAWAAPAGHSLTLLLQRNAFFDHLLFSPTLFMLFFIHYHFTYRLKIKYPNRSQPNPESLIVLIRMKCQIVDKVTRLSMKIPVPLGGPATIDPVSDLHPHVTFHQNLSLVWRLVVTVSLSKSVSPDKKYIFSFFYCSMIFITRLLLTDFDCNNSQCERESQKRNIGWIFFLYFFLVSFLVHSKR